MRKEIEIKIEQGRDANKVFKIKEMSASQMDRWAIKALILLGKGGNGGIAKLGTMGFKEILEAFGNAEYEKAEPLLQELLECCSFEKDGSSVVLKKDFIDGVVEDWTTLMRLKIEALKLNLGFLEQGDGLGSK